MLTALVEDIAKSPGCDVVTTWDARLGPCPLRDCDVRLIKTVGDELPLFRDLIRDSDAVWIIAPETNGELLKRTLQFRLVNDTEPPRAVPRRLAVPGVQLHVDPDDRQAQHHDGDEQRAARPAVLGKPVRLGQPPERRPQGALHDSMRA